jgi:hypothetical protein
MYVTVDQVAVPIDDWVLMLKGDEAAHKRLTDKLDGLVLYEHALSCGPTELQVGLRELDYYGIVKSITLHKDAL